MGGCRSVEMAEKRSVWWQNLLQYERVLLPLLLVSLTAPILVWKEVSRTPPTECIELAVELRRGWYRLAELDL